MGENSDGTKSHVDVLGSQVEVPASQIEKLWEDLDLTKPKSEYSRAVVREDCINELMFHSSEPILKDGSINRFVGSLALEYTSGLIRRLDEARRLGQPSVEINIPIFAHDDELVSSALDIVIAAFKNLNYLPKKSKGTRFSNHDLRDAVNTPKFYELRLDIL
jgi:hypothetical protein